MFRSLTVCLLLVVVSNGVDAFVAPGGSILSSYNKATTTLSSSSSAAASATTTTTTRTRLNTALNAGKKKLALLTFDLDDTLYPIAPVIDEANRAFARAMERYGYEGIEPNDIDQVSKQVRMESPEDAASMSHTKVREMSIRRQMEAVMLQRKLQETAEDWVTTVEDLAPVVVESAQKWTSKAVSETVVQTVLSAWEMERHHAAERNVYNGVTSVLKKIKAQHPDVIIGAVTDGKANPLLMTFTLAPYFDFCMSWEDDQKGRQQFFRDLSSSSTSAELSWIYNAAKEKGEELRQTKKSLRAASSGEKEDQEEEEEEKDDDLVWIHVGDDVAYDVGGSAACGANTILVELADEYEQTARHRFDSDDQPGWSTAPQQELEAHKAMNQASLALVDEKITFMSGLPDAVNSILTKQD